ncbi:2,4-dienoyl-CoA reductase [NADPH] [Lachnospiraceae bacterium KM106-2]|nr:2,4-dienoyl-CoA reductase [NADPH] [Lachnospiraceae bacterium KM106-2]
MRTITKTIEVNGVEFKNRLVMPPMATSKTVDGVVTQELLDYYDEKSKGGYFALIISEHSYVNHQGKADAGQVSASRDSDVEGLRKIVDVIHKNGSKVIAQINHAGAAAPYSVTGMPCISASAVSNVGLLKRNDAVPEEMTQEQIDQIISDFAMAARRVKEAGFDGVEIHSAHGYLLNQFYSPLVNKRNDAYTGSTLEGRLRIHHEIIDAVRKEVGEDYIVALRLGGCDYMEGGSTIQDSVEASKLFEEWGVNLLDISGGMGGFILPGHNEPGYFSEMTEAIKKQVSIPVILTGGITDIKDADRLLENNKADLIGVGRAVFKDSKWAEKNFAEIG